MARFGVRNCRRHAVKFANQQPPKRRPLSRNKAALVLFGRAVVITLSVVSGGLGFLTGIRMSSATYDPHNYATGVGALFAGACAVIAFLLMRRRKAKEKRRDLEIRLEELADRNWELREAEERARSLLEAQGDLIVRRDAQGRVTYANDAYCALAGKSREALLGQPAALPVLEQGALDILADGTRAHDQKIASGDTRALDRLARSRGARRHRQRSARRRPRCHRPCRSRTRLRFGARFGGSRQPRQIALPRHGQP